MAELKKAKVETVKEENPLTKKVKTFLFKDSHEYKDDLKVLVNGKCWIIQRGIDVEVPAYVKEVIDNSIKQDKQTADRIELLSQLPNSPNAVF